MIEQEKTLDIVNTSSIDINDNVLTEQLISSTNPEDIQNIINLFNISFQKKNTLRVQKLNQLQDKISDQIDERLTKKAGEFSNKDLLDYFKVFQDSINKNTLNLANQDNILPVQIIQNQTNIIEEKNNLSRESKDKIRDAVKSILNKLNSSEDDDIIYLSEENIEINE